MELITRNFGFTSKGSFEGKLCGRAIPFGEIYNFCGVKERFAPDLKIDLRQNLMLLRSHDRDKMLGKYPKTLSLEKKEDGLYFEAQKLETPLYEETQSLVDREVLTGVSPGFFVTRSHKDEGITVYDEIALQELSLCAIPAYKNTYVNTRQESNIILPPELYE